MSRSLRFFAGIRVSHIVLAAASLTDAVQEIDRNYSRETGTPVGKSYDGYRRSDKARSVFRYGLRVR